MANSKVEKKKRPSLSTVWTESRDLIAAHSVVSTAIGLARASGVGAPVLDAFDHRLGRIERRLAIEARRGFAEA